MLQSKIEAFLDSAIRDLGIQEKISFKVEVPPRPELGDFSTNLAILAARKLSRAPLDLASLLIDKLKQLDQGQSFSEITVANPGFINFHLNNQLLQGTLPAILQQDHAWGKSEKHSGQKILVEFVSANPTGPLHIGHGRWAVVGDVISRLLAAVGYKVETEYYINNVGNQVEMLEASVQALRSGKPLPEGGYGGAYVNELRGETRQEILEFILQEQKITLQKLGVNFNRWFYESELHAQNKVLWAVEKLHDLRATFEEKGAIWFKSKEMGDDKNRVLIREDGKPTYFASDIAYHLDKFARGYDHLIDIWGTDHHGYVFRLKAALQALGQPVDKLEIIIGQLVTLYRGQEAMRMSKRTGEMITLQEVLEEIGVDATRFFFSATDVNSHLDFDLELAKIQSSDNPVYYLQYAHARICSILKKSQNPTDPSQPGPDFFTLNHPAERELMIKLLSWPDYVEAAAKLRHPHRLTEFGKELAIIFHSFYEKCRVLGNPAREGLVDATRIVLRNVLELLGINAPEKM